MSKEKKIEKSIEIKAPASKVWRALIDPQYIKEYMYGTEAISDWMPGSSLRFTGTWEGVAYEDKGTILKMVPEKVLCYDYWSNFTGVPDVPDNYAVIEFTLEPHSAATALTVTQRNSPTESMYEHSEKGWKDVLEKIKTLLE